MIKLIKNRLLVRPIIEDITKNGIYLPIIDENIPAKGQVLSVGPGEWITDDFFQKTVVQPGHIIVYGKYAGMPITHEGEKLLVMSEDDVIAIIDMDSKQE
jgi:chaperonin GroES